MQNTVLILDFGSPYTQLIARDVRELQIFCEIHPYYSIPEDLSAFKAIILSGSSAHLNDEIAPTIDWSAILGKLPILTMGYSAQLLLQELGGKLSNSLVKDNLTKDLVIKVEDPLLADCATETQVWTASGFAIESLPENVVSLAEVDGKTTAFKLVDESIYGLQFYPQIFYSTEGKTLLRNFLVNIAGIKQEWTSELFIEKTVAELKEEIGEAKVVLGLSGGVDSTVAAILLHKAIGKNLHCIFVNNGLLRKNEFTDVLEQYEHLGLNVKGVDASQHFLGELKGVSDPEEKRKIIGRVFIEVFDKEAKAISGVEFLGQGTIYPDVIESVSVVNKGVAVKSHHNVGGLPDYMKLKIIEPLRMLFKDEVRRVGETLGISKDLIGRHPFPGPALAIRILGDITPEKVAILQEVDHLFIDGLRRWNLYDQVWQAGAILLPIQSVGVMHDERTYESVVALRAVHSVDGMTADWVPLPDAFLKEISNLIIHNVAGVNRVVYDISSKPPATIEWE